MMLDESERPHAWQQVLELAGGDMDSDAAILLSVGAIRCVCA